MRFARRLDPVPEYLTARLNRLIAERRAADAKTDQRVRRKGEQREFSEHGRRAEKDLDGKQGDVRRV